MNAANLQAVTTTVGAFTVSTVICPFEGFYLTAIRGEYGTSDSFKSTSSKDAAVIHNGVAAALRGEYIHLAAVKFTASALSDIVRPLHPARLA